MSLQKAMGTRKDHFLKKFGLTAPQMHILYAVAHKRLTVKDIASKMGITSSAATQIIEGLVNLNYVERKPDSQDHRVVHVQFSREGKKKFENFKQSHQERMGQIFAALTDQELDALISIPRKILRRTKKFETLLS